MHSVDTVVIVWTAVNATTSVFISAMIYTRIRNLDTLNHDPISMIIGERHDHEYRTFLAKQDIRRSVVRLLTSLIGLFIGAWVMWMQVADDQTHAGTLSRIFPYMLISMISIILVNEVWDRWSLHQLRSMYLHNLAERTDHGLKTVEPRTDHRRHEGQVNE